MYYCKDNGFPCNGANPNDFLQLFVDFRVTSEFCGVVSCPMTPFPVQLSAQVRFFAAGAGSSVEAEGIGTFNGERINHAFFGSAIQTPEPATWLLLPRPCGAVRVAARACSPVNRIATAA